VKKLASLVTIVIALSLAVTPVTAVTFHKYSVAYETSGSGTYTAVKVTRTNPAFSISPGTSCGTPLAVPVVYQSQWIAMTADGLNWVEIGTDHGCNGNQWVYWGYAVNGTWTLRGTLAVSASTSNHTYSIYRTAGNSWKFYYDTTLVDTVTWTKIGYAVSAGLESWDSGAVAARHSYTSLATEINQGSWQLWAGQDSVLVNGPEMCGAWTLAYEWRASENSTCL